MIFELLRLNVGVTDFDFNSIYPEKIKHLDKKHWTPVSVAKIASEFLVQQPGTKVLDIGSGAGKFCLIGASNTKGHFTGVEQRHELVELSQRLSAHYYIWNTRFIHGNISSVDFDDYDAFYFYNAFYENLNPGERIDDEVELKSDLYHAYSLHIVEQLAGCRLGTRLVTYCSPTTIIPRSFKLQDSLNAGLLKFWEKVDVY
jgi:SAM-dependent methyltransferase